MLRVIVVAASAHVAQHDTDTWVVDLFCWSQPVADNSKVSAVLLASLVLLVWLVLQAAASDWGCNRARVEGLAAAARAVSGCLALPRCFVAIDERCTCDP